MPVETVFIILSFVISIISALGLGTIVFVLNKFIRTLSPYQYEKLRGAKISNTKIQKRMDEAVDIGMNNWIKEPIIMDLFPEAVALATEKNAAPNFFASLLKRAAPAIPSLVAGTPADQVAAGETAKFAADILSSPQGLQTVSNVWDFVKLLVKNRTQKPISLPKNSTFTRTTNASEDRMT